MRIDFNYTKEGFVQIFPLLRITNDKEVAWIVGLWKYNVALVFGENKKPFVISDLPESSKQKINLDVSKMSVAQIASTVLCGVGAMVVIGYFLNKRRK